MGIKSKRLKRKQKWALKQEKDELQLQQKKLRMETDELLRNLDELRQAEIAAIKANDSASITLISARIDAVKEKIEDNDRRYASNTNIITNYSKSVKDDTEDTCSKLNTGVGILTGLGGLTLGAIGLKKAYESDVEGTLYNKKTLDWTVKMPNFLKGFLRK